MSIARRIVAVLANRLAFVISWFSLHISPLEFREGVRVVALDEEEMQKLAAPLALIAQYQGWRLRHMRDDVRAIAVVDTLSFPASFSPHIRLISIGHNSVS